MFGVDPGMDRRLLPKLWVYEIFCMLVTRREWRPERGLDQQENLQRYQR